MRKLGLGTAIIVIFLSTTILTAVQYLGYRLAGLPFSPADLYDWLVRIGLGQWLALVQSVTGFFQDRGQNLAEASRTAEWILSLGLFFLLMLLAGIVFYLLVGRRRLLPDAIDGVTIGAVAGVPMLLISLFAGRSLTEPVFVIIWVLGLFLLWGIGLSFAFRRLMQPVAVTVPAQPTGEFEDAPANAADLQAAARLDRRKFLFQLGASTAAITAVSAAAGTVIANRGAEQQAIRPFPIADPDFLANQAGLLGNFRRFAIVNYRMDRPADSEVVALGAEYPDRNYVSIWLGEGSPIVIYENLETALGAYRTEDALTDVVWLDA